ncbi:Splicing factor 3B subunit 2 [Orchesella cincta]|uniref:Splicing factor 3B subunit 2 n=1 Tax=Orchesella cincta TaxID=48709 RepID=A0A1D2NN09_ORCCI|nr:Splicing factor 3B subunit 2 [Orchesella cincta]
MDIPGEDSGFEFDDSNNAVDDSIVQQQIIYQENVEDLDEGIGLVQNPFVNPVVLQQVQFPGGPLPPHIQLQQAQEAFLVQQQQQQQLDLEVEPEVPLLQAAGDDDSNSANENRGNEGVPANNAAFQLDGDANNNDQPEDANNNTTDPALQQLQQQQLLMQQQQQNNLNNAAANTSNSVIENGVNGKDKKDKRKKKKKKKKNRLVTVIGMDGSFRKELPDGESIAKKNAQTNGDADENDEPEDNVDVEYVAEKLELSVFDPMYRAFANVFENFRINDASLKVKTEEDEEKTEDLSTLKKVPKIDLDDEPDEKKEDEKPKLSKRKLKKLTRLSVAELKQVVARPDVVEMHDVTAKDPKLLIHLKSYRNTVPVPRHWCYKRKYLQGKRGIEKAPFDLPGFIKKTGIMEMRAALAEKEDQKTLKAKMRERVRPKMGKIDIDYQKLHDAFFKWQSKPKMTIHGDLYYEGKEFETRMKDKKPGELSDDLRTALGMPVGPTAHRVPPPWLIAMQRYGPPPSYPHLKIPGLNAPIPDGCSFGYHAGGWGKPPVDEMGRPLYGDVFGVMNQDDSALAEEELIDKNLWGELESEEESESEEEEEEEEEDKEEEEAEAVEDSGLQTPAEGLATPSGFSSVPAGLETPEMIELRKRRIEQDMEGGETPSLYTVLPEKRVDRISGAMMASTHVYDLTGVKEKSRAPGFAVKDTSTVELALDPSELDLVDTAAMEARYEQTLKEKQAYSQGEDLSDMVAEHTAKQKNKRKRQMQQQDMKKGAKKQREFKF